MTEVNNEVLVAIMSFKSSADVLNAVMNHPTIDPFYENNSLIKTIIDRDYSTDYLSAVLHHSKNKLTSDDYRAIINDMKPSSDKLTLIESLIL